MLEQTHIAITQTLLVALIRNGVLKEEAFITELLNVAKDNSPAVAKELKDIAAGLISSKDD